MEMNNKTIDINAIKEVIKTIRSGETLDAYQLLQLKEKGLQIEQQILEIARMEFSDAAYSSNASSDPDRVEVFSIHDIKGFVIAYMWVDENGKTTIHPNENAYAARMN